MNQQQLFEKKQATHTVAQHSFCWKFIHGLGSLIGGITFPFADFAYFPVFARVVDSQNLAGWLYTIGSFTFVVSDTMEWWYHYSHPNPTEAPADRLKISLNNALSALSSLLYLIGSIFFIPATDQLWAGCILFIIGSVLIMISEAWKAHRSMTSQPTRPWKQNIKADTQGFVAGVLFGVGGFLYLLGTALYMREDGMEDPMYLFTVIVFCLGGMSFFVSALIIQKKYFFRRKNQSLL